MKYKCLDCGAVYDKKIEYCDCGNNTFEQIEQLEPKKLVYKPTLQIPKGEILSWGIFGFCIVLALLILFAIPNNNQSVLPEDKGSAQIERKDIPDIEKIWKNPQPTQPEIVENTEPIVIVKKIIKRVEEPAQSAPKQNVQKPVSKPVQQNVTTPKQETKPQQTVSKPTAQPIVEKTKTNSADPAVIRYKYVLREVLLSKLAVGSIPGTGTCIIEFSVDSTGKLVNRKFVQYANNKPMNDAIYHMLMSVPRFETPPSTYQGEAIRLKFFINNGEYEISFV